MTADPRRVSVIFLLVAAVGGGSLTGVLVDRNDSEETKGASVLPSTTTVDLDSADDTGGQSDDVIAMAEPIDPTTTGIGEPGLDAGATEPDADFDPGLPPRIVVEPHPELTRVPAHQIAELLATVVRVPSDCGLPLDSPESLPNAARDYRSGVHQGIDFICGESGRDALAALDGRVVMAVGDYVDPSPEDRQAVLDTAASVGRTPPWTLALLFGNFVALDHGVIDGVGHVATIYAHLEAIDDAIRPGVAVTAGQRLGEIGNHGTLTAATGSNRPQSLHLHWEIHVDDLYLGAGLTTSETRDLYATLFSPS